MDGMKLTTYNCEMDICMSLYEDVDEILISHEKDMCRE